MCRIESFYWAVRDLHFFFSCSCITVFVLPFFVFLVFNDLLRHLVMQSVSAVLVWHVSQASCQVALENITIAALQRAYLLPPQTRLNSTEVNLILRLLSPWHSAANSEQWSPYRTPSFRYIAFVPAQRFCVDCALTCANKTAKPWHCVCSFAW